MADEIERRYVVSGIDPDIRRAPSQEIEQGYLLTGANSELRVRIIDGREAVLTKKEGFGEKRDEVNHPVALETAQLLYRETPYRLQKTRYRRDGWEVDFFHPPLDGLVLAEYELPAGVTGFPKLPPWITSAYEVTHSITNLHLARLAHDLAEVRSDRPIRELLSVPVPRIVLTGGPCSGKSTLMSLLRAQFERELHCVPEVATIIISQVGVTPPAGHVERRRFQRTMAHVQLGFEEISQIEAAHAGKRALLLDRGRIDNAAYLPGGLGEFEQIVGTTRSREFRRYDLVICLAMPPESVYEASRATNPARSETYAAASALDRRIQEVWGPHPNYHLVGAHASWAEKVGEVTALIRDFLAPR